MIGSHSENRTKAIKKATEATAGGGASSVVGKGVYTVQDALHTTHVAAALGHAHDVAGIMASAPFGILGVAAGTSVSAYFNHLALKAKSSDLLDNYRPQIASIVSKTPDKVHLRDLESVAEVNPAINNEMKRNKKMRVFGTVKMAIATSVAFVAVFASIALFPPLGALAGAAAASGLLSGAGVGFVAAAGVISFGALHAAGAAVGAIGKKLLHLDKHTVEDHVQTLDEHLKDGKLATKEEVMGIFTAASPGLQGRVKYTFGKEYDHLSSAEQTNAVLTFGRELDLDNVTKALNSGELPAREMPFFVFGQTSGAPHPQAMRDKQAAEHLAEQELRDKGVPGGVGSENTSFAANVQRAERPTATARDANQNWQEQVSKKRDESVLNAAAAGRA